MQDSMNVLVHINEELDSDHRKQFSSDICGCAGVLSVDLKEERPHLMMVAYDSLKIRSLDVLANVQNQGVHAQLVAWL